MTTQAARRSCSALGLIAVSASLVPLASAAFSSSRVRWSKPAASGKPSCCAKSASDPYNGDFIVLHFVNADDNSTPPSSSTQGSLRAGGAIRRKKQIPRVLPLRAGMAKLFREAKKPVLSSWGRAKTADRTVRATRSRIDVALGEWTQAKQESPLSRRSLIIARGVLGREVSYAAFACAMRR